MVTARSKVTGLSNRTSSDAVRRGSDPEGIGIVVEGFAFGGGCADVALCGDEVVAVDAVEGCTEFAEAVDIGCRKLAGVVGGEAQHELRAASDSLGVDVEQLIDGAQCGFIVGVPEPVAAWRGVSASTGRQRR